MLNPHRFACCIYLQTCTTNNPQQIESVEIVIEKNRRPRRSFKCCKGARLSVPPAFLCRGDVNSNSINQSSKCDGGISKYSYRLSMQTSYTSAHGSGRRYYILLLKFLSFFLFFRHRISEMALYRQGTFLAHKADIGVILKIGSKIWGATPHENLGAPNPQCCKPKSEDVVQTYSIHCGP